MRLTKMLRVAGLVALLGVLAAPAMARLRVDTVSYFLPGVSTSGALSWANGRWGTAKIYNYTRLDLLTAVATAKVTNQSGRIFIESDLGIDLYDFDNGVWRVATSDLFVVGPKRGTAAALATGVAIYNPLLDPYRNAAN